MAWHEEGSAQTLGKRLGGELREVPELPAQGLEALLGLSKNMQSRPGRADPALGQKKELDDILPASRHISYHTAAS